ncbi:uncharacterized protein PADG_12328 [Paracoccidioides brasiliensis Pb18]|uniref:Uncharacterized protein n=1 Tax=Paracoccidioides brasiliensis (strain Pb18) TaxID=502780 RepID=A0A0A0HTB6_PARBD|nr:uncharacterized protein PADG_12328 [Paracoccidioides brasiliensis Pb18]KGM91553.1 hypothetical protein PADG_12328 [Paracoccidioides brasiliensis Pb18]
MDHPRHYCRLKQRQKQQKQQHQHQHQHQHWMPPVRILRRDALFVPITVRRKLAQLSFAAGWTTTGYHHR